MSGLSIDSTVEIAAAPERIWQALTDPAQTPLYFYGARVQSGWNVGDSIEYFGEGDALMTTGTLLAVDAPRRLAATFSAVWDPTSAADRPSRVSFTIEPVGSGSRLSVTHDDFDGETSTYNGVRDGWPYVLNGIKSVIETGKPLPMPAQA
jgi:uncharacterized protein YndB with AHSA1/START domain